MHATIAVIPTCDFLCIPTSKMAGIPLTGKKYGPFPGAKMDAPTFALIRGHLCPELFLPKKLHGFCKQIPILEVIKPIPLLSPVFYNSF